MNLKLRQNPLTDEKFANEETKLCNPMNEANFKILRIFKNDEYYYWQAFRERLKAKGNIYYDDIIVITRASRWKYKIIISNVTDIESRYYQEFLSTA